MSTFRWKGKIISEKKYKLRLKQIENGKSRKKPQGLIPIEPKCPIEGRRLVELQVMAQYMYCIECKSLLSLDNIEKEVREGLGSIFSIRCRDCLLLNTVPSGKQQVGEVRKVFDVNQKAALGTLHAGLGYTTVNKLLQTMNVPYMCSKTYKKYERQVGPVIEQLATESCQRATETERLMTINNFKKLQEKL